MSYHLKKGDQVEIVANIPHQLVNLPKPIIGTVLFRDGEYVIVRPLYKRFTVECLSNELRRVVLPI